MGENDPCETRAEKEAAKSTRNDITDAYRWLQTKEMNGVRVTRCLEEEAATHFSHVVTVTVTVTAAVHCKHPYVTLHAFVATIC